MIDVNYVKSALFGVAIGDALGVPVEFFDRLDLKSDPVIDMRSYGTHHMPTGTFSDDSSLTFCLAEALCNGFDLNNIANNFVKWRYDGYWTTNGYVFDVGFTTDRSINRILKGISPEVCGDVDVTCNGNGSLMRILPILFYIKDKSIQDRYEIIRQVSSITHGHVRSVISCFYYLEFAREILLGIDKFDIYQKLKLNILDFLYTNNINPAELSIFSRLLDSDKNIFNLSEGDIYSSGYVVHTLEAAIWCLLTTDSYRDCVIKAVNLGEDTDTVAAVVGGLAGLLYGIDNIPVYWIQKLKRSEDIADLADRLTTKLNQTQSS